MLVPIRDAPQGILASAATHPQAEDETEHNMKSRPLVGGSPEWGYFLRRWPDDWPAAAGPGLFPRWILQSNLFTLAAKSEIWEIID